MSCDGFGYAPIVPGSQHHPSQTLSGDQVGGRKTVSRTACREAQPLGHREEAFSIQSHTKNVDPAL
jgi:hypothetical protein